MTSSYGGLLETRGSKLTVLKSMFNAENLVCRLSWSIFADFTFEMRLQPEIAKFTKSPYFGGSRSSMLVLPESLSAVLIMISSKSVSTCNRSHSRQANSGKITIS